MDLNKIAIFVRAMDAGSFTKAARFLKQPKSRVARNVAALERGAGMTLIYRTTRQFSPTEAGRALHERCRDLVYALEGATTALKENSTEVSGRLRLTAATDFGSVLLGPLIAELSAIHPAVDVELHLSDDYVDLVKEGMDLAIRIGTLEDASLKARLIGHLRMIPVASPDYLKRSPKVRSLKDLALHPALHFRTEETESPWRLISGAGESESVKVRSHCSSNNPTVLLHLAIEGRGVALLPDFVCIEALKAKRLKRVLERYSSSAIPVHFVWPTQREMSPKVRAFVDLGIKRLSKIFS